MKKDIRGEEEGCFLNLLHIFSIQLGENIIPKKIKDLVRSDF